MNTYEAKVLLENSLRCLAISMEQIRLREIDKVVGREEPMQDYLAECTRCIQPYQETSAEDCLNYLKNLYRGFCEASDHTDQIEGKFSVDEYELGNVCDMIMGHIEHDFPDNLVECAREIYKLAINVMPAKDLYAKSKSLCEHVVASFEKQAAKIIEDHGCKTWNDGEYSLPLSYLGSWMERVYWNY